jgi:hypothetical protein
MAVKGKKLHPDDIQRIKDFTMTYKDLATFAMSYKELAQLVNNTTMCYLEKNNTTMCDDGMTIEKLHTGAS